jgi:hypothetical protein
VAAQAPWAQHGPSDAVVRLPVAVAPHMSAGALVAAKLLAD